MEAELHRAESHDEDEVDEEMRYTLRGRHVAVRGMDSVVLC